MTTASISVVTDPKRFGRVAVLMGGTSSEREVSLDSGRNVLEALRSRGVDAQAVDGIPALVVALGGQKFDRVFNILHGGDFRHVVLVLVLADRHCSWRWVGNINFDSCIAWLETLDGDCSRFLSLVFNDGSVGNPLDLCSQPFELSGGLINAGLHGGKLFGRRDWQHQDKSKN